MFKIGDKFFALGSSMKIKEIVYQNNTRCQYLIKTGNCFETKLDAEVYLQTVLEGEMVF